MRTFFYRISLFSIACFAFTHNKAESLIVATLMIKNEASLIRQTLQPLIEGGITDFLIFDTGSTDETLNIVQQLFQQQSECCAHIFQEPFIDFATSRNRALELAEMTFPSVPFTLMVDAEWYLHGVDKLVHYCKASVADTISAYAIRVVTNANEFNMPLLMRSSYHLRYKGAVHECLQISEATQAPSEVFFEFRRSDKGQASTEKRWLRDKEILLKEYQAHPSDSRTLFYLGQTYCCLNDFVPGLDFFNKCIPAALTEGDIDRAYESAYRAALVIEELIKQKEDYSWELVLHYYHKAFELCPYRAERLFRIAQYYYFQKDMELCFKYALHASKLPFPYHVSGFVERYVYDRGCYELLYESAFALGNYTIAQSAYDHLSSS